MSLVSLLIPVYNREKYLVETIESALAQTYHPLEIIIVDNYSTDDSWELIRKYAQSHNTIRAFRNDTNIGAVRNWQRCVEEARGEYIKILWSDDLIAPAFIEKSLPYLATNNDIGFVFTGAEVFSDDIHARFYAYGIGDTGIYSTRLFIEGALLHGEFPASPGNALFRKDDVKKNLLLDIPNKIGSDFKMHAIGNDELIYLLTAKDYPKFAFINSPLSFFRLHRDSITVSSGKERLSMLRYVAKSFFAENYLDDENLRRKFNAKLFIMCLKNRINRHNMLTSVKDFYFDERKADVDLIFVMGLFRRFVCSRLARSWAIIACPSEARTAVTRRD